MRQRPPTNVDIVPILSCRLTNRPAHLKGEAAVTWLRDVDRWFIDEILPHRVAFRRQAARLVPTAEAEDLVQEAYARAINASHHREIVNPRSFVLTIIRNLAHERHRRATVVRFEHLADMEAMEIADSAPDQFAVLSGNMELARLIALMEQLPPQARAVVKMRRIEGLLPGDIAVRMGLSVSTVETQLATGLAIRSYAMQEAPPQEERAPFSRLWQRHRHQRK